jgi:hypothetical protein
MWTRGTNPYHDPMIGILQARYGLSDWSSRGTSSYEDPNLALLYARYGMSDDAIAAEKAPAPTKVIAVKARPVSGLMQYKHLLLPAAVIGCIYFCALRKKR